MGRTACRHFCHGKESTLVLGYLSCPLFAQFGRLFHTFWFHVGSNWASEAWTRDTWYFLDFKGGSRKAPYRGGRVVITWFGALLPINKLANYLLSTKPTTFEPSTAEQQIQDYRTTSTHTAWWPLTSRGRRIYIYIYIWHVLVCFGNGLGSQEAPKWPPGETRRG